MYESSACVEVLAWKLIIVNAWVPVYESSACVEVLAWKLICPYLILEFLCMMHLFLWMSGLITLGVNL